MFSEWDDLCRSVSGETEKRGHYRKKDRKNRGGRLAELCLYCDISLGVTEKYDFSLLNNNTYQQSALRKTV